MKLLMVCFHTNGAIRDGFIQLCNYLVQDNELVILANRGITSSDISGSKVFTFAFDKQNLSSFFKPWKFLELKKIIDSFNYDCAFIYYFHPINLYLFLIIDYSRLAFFVHDHIVHLGTPIISRLLMNMQLCKMYKSAKALIVSSEWMKDQIIDKHFVADPNRIYVNYLGLLENHLYPKMVNEDIDVLFFGRVEYYKGLDVLIESHQYLSDQRVTYTIVGRGELVETFHLKSVPSYVTHINRYVSDEELAEYIQRSKMIVLPYYEATGTQTIPTIFYYKKPVITTNVGCFPEYVTDKIDGIVIPSKEPEFLANAISYLLENEGMRKQMGEKGKEKITTLFSNESINRKYIEIFTTLMNNNQR